MSLLLSTHCPSVVPMPSIPSPGAPALTHRLIILLLIILIINHQLQLIAVTILSDHLLLRPFLIPHVLPLQQRKGLIVQG